MSAAPSLLSPSDPPPVETVNEDGTADLLLVCDHASNRIPAALGDLGLAPADLLRHIAWDPGAAAVARLLSLRFDAPLVLAGYSRLVVDCNRREDDPTLVVRLSEDTVVPGNRAVGAAELEARLAACYRPYHEALAARVRAFRARRAVPALVSVHSFTPVYKGAARPWHVGVLWNRDPRIARPLMAALESCGDLVVGDNKPYSARGEVGYTIDTHGEAFGYPSVLVELRNDLVADEEGVARWAGILGAALAPILADPATRRPIA